MKRSVLVVLFIALIFSSVCASALMQEINYNVDQKTVTSSPRFVVQTLKYEPYPVNSGDWFDLWVKVQNIGQDDAQNSEFKLILAYPFSSNDTLVRDYGLVPGAASALRSKQLSDPDVQANQVIMKFRVMVADNAPVGESIIQLQTTADKLSGQGNVYDLPIDIRKTKTDFEVVMQDITPQGTSFMITNAGDNKASSVTLAVKSDSGISLLGSRTVVVGDLDKGDFTVAHLNFVPLPETKSVTLELSYTDQYGARVTSEKQVVIESPVSLSQICQNNTGTSTKWIYGIIGIILGAVLVLVLAAFNRKLMSR
ncbi:MAG: hypothetical protein WCK90_02240 [archaeon]